MTSNVDRMIDNLTPAINQKCEELQTARKERLQSRIFALLCILTAVIPTLSVLMGVSLTLLIVPFVFMSLSAVLLLPVLLSGKTASQGGTAYEQT